MFAVLLLRFDISAARLFFYIYLRGNPAKFHPDPILNDGSLGFLKRSPQQEEEQEQENDEWRFSPVRDHQFLI